MITASEAALALLILLVIVSAYGAMAAFARAQDQSPR